MPLTIPEDFSWCLLSTFVMGIQYGLMGPWTMKTRIPIFNREFMKKNFSEEHKNSGIRTPLWGYPDFGTGVYSNKLSYPDWLKFNSALRVHMNTMEYIAIAIVSVLVLGLFKPCLAAGFGILWVLSRFFYGYTYLNNIQGLKKASFLSFGIILATSGIALWNIYKHLK
jgi:uncharacterized membrane protein YecN with MAPEG domain